MPSHEKPKPDKKTSSIILKPNDPHVWEPRGEGVLGSRKKYYCKGCNTSGFRKVGFDPNSGASVEIENVMYIDQFESHGKERTRF